MEPFPRLSHWHDQQSASLPRLPDYLHAVSYNLEAAHLAAHNVRRPGAGASCLANEGKVYLLSHDSQAMARAGDAAIRCAISALELALQLTNYVLDVAFPKTKVSWRAADKRRDSFRAAVVGRLGSSHPVVQVIDRIFSSYQYTLFKNYRNWVAHRGAPKVQLPQSPTRSVIIGPASSAHEESTEAEVSSFLLDHCTVVSLPFVPPIRALIDDERGQSPEDVALGISGTEGSQLKLRNNYVVVGDPLMDEGSFRTANPHELGGDVAEMAGEMVRVYSAHEYASAVTRAVSFVRDCLSEKLDHELTRACDIAA